MFNEMHLCSMKNYSMKCSFGNNSNVLVKFHKKFSVKKSVSSHCNSEENFTEIISVLKIIKIKSLYCIYNLIPKPLTVYFPHNSENLRLSLKPITTSLKTWIFPSTIIEKNGFEYILFCFQKVFRKLFNNSWGITLTILLMS